MRLSDSAPVSNADEIPFTVLIPSFITSELKTAFQNSQYFQNILDKGTRDLSPWPHHPHKGFEYSRSQIETIASVFIDFELKWEVEWDGNYNNPESQRWNTIAGSDVDIDLSIFNSDLAKKKDFFLKQWFLTLKRPKEVLNTQAEATLREVERRLETGELDLVGPLLQDLQVELGEDARVYNLKGVYAFYQNDSLGAYLNFLEAVERQQNRQDFWENLMDAAKVLSRESDVLTLAKKFQNAVGFLAGLVLQWEKKTWT